MKLSKLPNTLSAEDVLTDCVRILATEPDFNIAVNKFLEYIGHFYQADRACIFEFNFENRTIRNSYEWCISNAGRELHSLQSVSMECISEWIHRFKESGEFFMSSPNNDSTLPSPEYELFKNREISGLMSAPLMKAGKIIGFLSVDDPHTHTDDLTLLRSSAHFITIELEKRQMVNHLHRASFTDFLTGLKNRTLYIRAMENYDHNPPDSLGVIFIDVNGMKRNNDTYGHKYGDEILIQISDILKKHAPENSYRIGSDEFVIFLENTDKKTFEKKAFMLKTELKAHKTFKVSVGSVWQQGHLNIPAQISHADEIMYAEKQSYYKETFTNGFSVRSGIADDILQQIKEHQFLVCFQPQINLRTKEIIGAEALVRKKGADGRMIPPYKFIPYYEMEGVIRHIDLFVLETACAAIQKWHRAHIGLCISVNFSRVTLMEPNILQTILGICSQYHVSPAFITIEITESISKLDFDTLGTLIHAFRDAGFRISLDDFGSKYSNLSILTAIDFHEVKLDKSLIQDLTKNKKSQIVMKNTIQLCREFEHTYSLAEGIETREQLDMLMAYGCEFGQGFLFSKPLPLEQFNALLKKIPYPAL